MEKRLFCLGNEYRVVGPEATRHPLPVPAQRGGESDRIRRVIVLGPGLEGRHRVEMYNPRGVRVVPGASALRCAGYALGQGCWELETDTGIRRVYVRGGETVLGFPPPVYGGDRPDWQGFSRLSCQYGAALLYHLSPGYSRPQYPK